MKKILESEENKRLALDIANSVVQAAIAYGDVDISGLSDEEAKVKLVEYLEELVSSEQEIVFKVDHKDTLLLEARELVSQDKANLAVVIYATWWEHWLNGLLEIQLYKKDISHKEFKQIITSLNNRAKTTWFLKLINLPEMAESHLKVMTQLADKRNSFVHYKYPPTESSKGRDSLEEFFNEVESAIEYFMEYESVNVYQSKKGFKLDEQNT
ncbi:hypothetical protein AB0613_004540 [Vibrio parahaemolyticus]